MTASKSVNYSSATVNAQMMNTQKKSEVLESFSNKLERRPIVTFKTGIVYEGEWRGNVR
jgi:hypothetical protein